MCAGQVQLLSFPGLPWAFALDPLILGWVWGPSCLDQQKLSELASVGEGCLDHSRGLLRWSHSRDLLQFSQRGMPDGDSMKAAGAAQYQSRIHDALRLEHSPLQKAAALNLSASMWLGKGAPCRLVGSLLPWDCEALASSLSRSLPP